MPLLSKITKIEFKEWTLYSQHRVIFRPPEIINTLFPSLVKLQCPYQQKVSWHDVTSQRHRHPPLPQQSPVLEIDCMDTWVLLQLIVAQWYHMVMVILVNIDSGDSLLPENTITWSHYGFRRFHSTELAALELTDRIRQQIDQKKVPFSVFLDLSKAFDTLNHDILLTKLRYYGIKGTSLSWFTSYLENRYQYVECNGTSSSLKEIETGVPQGSILGPLLFIIYMNDIHFASENFKFILYADDTTLVSPLCSFTLSSNSNDINQMSSLINFELSKISDWLAVNKLSLNAEKTKYMIFHNYQKVIAENNIPHLTLNGSVIERVTQFNFLGLTINENMNWKSHSSKIANKISRTLGVMNRLKRYLPMAAMKLMYDSLILSHLQFGITCWGFDWNRIFKLQKRAMRIMTNKKFNAHTEPIFKELKMLKIKDIFNIQCLKFCSNLKTTVCHLFSNQSWNTTMNFTILKQGTETNSTFSPHVQKVHAMC